MKKLVLATAALVALSTGAAFAAEAAPAATPQAVELTDTQLDATTGGLLSILNNVLSSNSGLVNANVNVPVNVSNISLLSKGKQTSYNTQNAKQGITTGNTGVIQSGHPHG